MDLKNFITNTLVSLVEGVKDAHTLNKGIAPPHIHSAEKDKGLRLTNQSPVFQVDFDIAVTASDKSEAGMKTGITVVSFIAAGAGTKHDSTTENSTVSRVKFSVPIVYNW